MGLGLCPAVSAGAIEYAAAHGSTEQSSSNLAKLVSGEWTGTMT